MKRITYLLLFGCNLAFSEPDGFGKIKFGTQYQIAKSRIDESECCFFKSEKDKCVQECLDSLLFRDYPDKLILDNGFAINGYDFGGERFDIYLIFNDEKEFCEFQIVSSEYSADDLDPYVYEKLKFIEDVFRRKYGLPTKVNPRPTILGIKPNYNAFTARWNKKDTDTYTAITVEDSKYIAKGVVSWKRGKNKSGDKRNKSVEDAAGSF